MHAHLTSLTAASFSVKLEWGSENGLISLEPLFADCGTMSFNVSGLTLVKSWSSCPNSFAVQLGSASTSSCLPLQVTDIRAILCSSILFLTKTTLCCQFVFDKLYDNHAIIYNQIVISSMLSVGREDRKLAMKISSTHPVNTMGSILNPIAIILYSVHYS